MNRQTFSLIIYVILTTFCFYIQAAAQEPVSSEELLAVHGLLMEAINAHNMDQWLSYCTDDFVFDYVPAPPPTNKAETKADFELMFLGFPDFLATPSRVTVSGNIIVDEKFFTATHQGEWEGIPATGNSIQMPVLDIFEFEGDKLKKVTTYLDAASWMVQIGAMPAPDFDPALLVPSFALPDPVPNELSPVEAVTEALARWGAEDLAGNAEFLCLDAEIFMPSMGIAMDRDAFAALSEMVYFTAFSFGEPIEVVRSIDMGGNWVVLEVVYRSTHIGPFMGIPATGLPVELRGALVYKVSEDGLIEYFASYYDTLTILAQIGALEPAPPDTEANKAIVVREFVEVWNQQNLDVIDEIYGPDNVFHDPAETGFMGPEGYRQFVSMYLTAFPDVQFTIEEQIAVGDKVATLWTATGTHQGELMGIPPTDVYAITTGINIAQVINGQIVEEWAHWDALGQMQQLGVITPARPAPENYMWGAPSGVVGEAGDPEANMAIVMRNIEEVWNQGNLDVLDELLSPDHVAHSPVEITSPMVGIEASKAGVAAYLAAFPDLVLTVEDMFAEGDMVVTRWSSTGTHEGELADIPATGRQTQSTGILISRVVDGLITDSWWAWDALGLIQQLTAPSQEEVNKAIEHRVFDEIWNQGNLDVADEVFAPDAVLHGLAEDMGPEGFKQFVAMYRAAIPDLKWVIEDQIAEGDMVATRLTGTGTHQGTLMGIPPTGAQITSTVIAVVRVVDGKIQESWNSVDMLGVMQQLGVVSPGRENYGWADPSAATGDPGDPEANKATVMRYIEEFWNQKNLDVLDELASPDIVSNSPVEPGNPVVGIEINKQACSIYMSAFPDLHTTVDHFFAEADKVVEHWTVTATHQGEIMGISPSGKPVTWTGTTIYRLADGKIVDNWWAWDALGLMQQLTAAAQLEMNKATARRMLEEIWNQGALDVADEIFTSDFTRHDPGNPDLSGVVGPDGYKQLIAAYRAAFPDTYWTVDDIIAEGDMVGTRWTSVGTQTGELMGIPATGLPVTVTGISSVRLADGKIAEEWVDWDAIGLMEQLGLSPATRTGYAWSAQSEVTGDPGDPEANKAIVTQHVEAWNQHNTDLLDEIMIAGSVHHDPVMYPGEPDLETYKQVMGIYFNAFPDIHCDIDITFAEGDKVVMHGTASGTHQGELMGIPATGRQVLWTWTTVSRIADGKIVDTWWQYDVMGLMTQITPEAPAEEIETGSFSFETWLKIVKVPQYEPEERSDGLYLVATSPGEFVGDAPFLFDATGNLWTLKSELRGEFQELKVNFDENGVPVSAIGPARGSTKLLDADGNVAFYGSYMLNQTLLLTPDFKSAGASPVGYFVATGVGSYAGLSILETVEGKIVPNPENPEEIGYALSGRGELTKQVITSKPPTGHHLSEAWYIYEQDYGLVPEKRADGLYLVSTKPNIAVGDYTYIFDNGEQITGHTVMSGTHQELKVIVDDKGVPVSAEGSSYSVTLRGYDSYGSKLEGVLQFRLSVSLSPDMQMTGAMAEADVLLQVKGKFADYIDANHLIITPEPDPDDPTKLIYHAIGSGTMTEVTGFSSVGMHSMQLQAGLNMISMPLKPIEPLTARSLADELGATVVIECDESTGLFTAFTMDSPGNGFPIEAGEGYIVNMLKPMEVEFMGTIWGNVPLFEAAPSPVNRSAWAFVVSGSVLDGENMSAADGGYILAAKNLRTGATATKIVDASGYFAAVWADLSRKSVVEAGDKVEVTVIDSRGKVVSGPFVHEVTLDQIRDAVVKVQLQLGHIIPDKTALLQNYPNPFNPETWIPFHLKDAADVSIRIFGSDGRLVRELELGRRDAGVYSSRSKAAYWDGRNEVGEEVASGIYFYTIQTGDFAATRKMVIAR